MSVHGKVQYVTEDEKWHLEITGRLNVTQRWNTASASAWTTRLRGYDSGTFPSLFWSFLPMCVTWRRFPSLEIFPAGASALPSVSMTGHRSLLLAMQSTHKHAALSHSWVQHSRALWCREKTIRSVSEILNPSQQIPSQKCYVMPYLQILGVPLSRTLELNRYFLYWTLGTQ